MVRKLRRIPFSMVGSLVHHITKTLYTIVSYNGLLYKIPYNPYMAVSENRGTPKWMVKIMENPIKMDGLGVPLFSETSI